MVPEFLSTSQVAKILGISRVAVFKKIKSGEIPARKAGRNFIIAKEDVPGVLSTVLTESKKRVIEESVKKTVKEYRETLKLLGQE